jgi:hypothetical protein
MVAGGWLLVAGGSCHWVILPVTSRQQPATSYQMGSSNLVPNSAESKGKVTGNGIKYWLD